MPKYTFEVTYYPETFTLDTDYYLDDFAKTKDELVDKLDPNDPDVVHDFLREQADGDLMDFGLSPVVDQITLKKD